MALAIPRSMSPAMLRKLHALAEQRCAYFIELHQSGRWRRYYTAEQLTAEMRGAVQIAERFHQMVSEIEGDQTTVDNVVPLFAKAS
jgi:hypothetical protein